MNTPRPILLLPWLMLSGALASGCLSCVKGWYYTQEAATYPVRKLGAWTKSQPVVFYGRVVDWEGNPVPGAMVTMNLRSGIDRNLVRTTDAEGRFGQLES